MKGFFVLFMYRITFLGNIDCIEQEKVANGLCHWNKDFLCYLMIQEIRDDTCFCFQKWPYFGPYQRQREETISELKKQTDLLAENLKPPLRSYHKPTTKVPAVKDIIGRALPKIGPFMRLDNGQQVVAVIDDVSI